VRAESFEVERADVGLRLDRLLVQRYPEETRAHLARLIKSGHARLDQTTVKAGCIVKQGQIVAIEWPPEEPSPWEAEPMDLDILYEDAEILVVSKPAGLVVHPAPGHRGGTLVNALVAHVADLPVTEDVSKPGIVHRLDRDTSGVMVVAKTRFSLQRLQKQFAARQVSKTYQALVIGVPELLSGRIDRALVRSRRDRSKMQVTREGGRESTTLWRLLERFDGLSLLEAKPVTGRTHQIRVHLAWLGHPVVADSSYGHGKLPRCEREDTLRLVQQFPRQALHALRIEFDHPRSHERVCFESPLASDFSQLLKVLREQCVDSSGA